MPIQAHAWYAGWNHQSSVVNVELDVALYMDSPLVAFALPVNEGEPFERADASIVLLGKEILEWRIDAMTRDQYWDIRHNKCSDGYSGPVTVYSLGNDKAWHYWNATLQLAPEKTYEQVAGGGMLNVIIRFVIDSEVTL